MSIWLGVAQIPFHGHLLVNRSILAFKSALVCVLCFICSSSHPCPAKGLSDPSFIICAMAVVVWALGASICDQDKCPSLSSDHFLPRENGQRAQDQGMVPGTGTLRREQDPQEEAMCWHWTCGDQERGFAKWLGQNLETLGNSMTFWKKIKWKNVSLISSLHYPWS